eukprot:m.61163 g.61163  ORF g.61163 m.61163 type:complete len:1713 (-) comp11849_c1_seq2:955-6093(-)
MQPHNMHASVSIVVIFISLATLPAEAILLSDDVSFQRLCDGQSTPWQAVGTTDHYVHLGCNHDPPSIDGVAFSAHPAIPHETIGIQQKVTAPTATSLRLTAWVRASGIAEAELPIGKIMLIRCDNCDIDTTYGYASLNASDIVFEFPIQSAIAEWALMQHTFTVDATGVYLFGIYATCMGDLSVDQVSISSVASLATTPELTTFNEYPDNWVGGFAAFEYTCPPGHAISETFTTVDTGIENPFAWRVECEPLMAPWLVDTAETVWLSNTSTANCGLQDGKVGVMVGVRSTSDTGGTEATQFACRYYDHFNVSSCQTTLTLEGAPLFHIHHSEGAVLQGIAWINDTQAAITMCTMDCPEGRQLIGLDCRVGTASTHTQFRHHVTEYGVFDTIAATGNLGVVGSEFPEPEFVAYNVTTNILSWALKPEMSYDRFKFHFQGLAKFKMLLEFKLLGADHHAIANKDIHFDNLTVEFVEGVSTNHIVFTILEKVQRSGQDTFALRVESTTFLAKTSFRAMILNFHFQSNFTQHFEMEPINWNYVQVAYDTASIGTEVGPFVSTIDSDPPSFGKTCPTEDIVAVLDSPLDSEAYVSYKPIIATDNSGTVEISSSHLPSNPFPGGRTQVVVNATDPRGNMAQCIFHVVVRRTNATLKLQVESPVPVMSSLIDPGVGMLHTFHFAANETQSASVNLTGVTVPATPVPEIPSFTANLFDYGQVCMIIRPLTGYAYVLHKDVQLVANLQWTSDVPASTDTEEEHACRVQHSFQDFGDSTIAFGDADLNDASHAENACKITESEVELHLSMLVEAGSKIEAMYVCAEVPTTLKNVAAARFSPSPFSKVAMYSISKHHEHCMHLEDIQPPTLANCVAELNYTLPPDASNVTFTLPSLNVTDNDATFDVTRVLNILDRVQTLPYGTHHLISTAQDATGNVGYCNTTVNVFDVTAPVVSCPTQGSIEIETDADSNSTVLDERGLPVYDNSGNYTVTSPAFGQTAYVGQLFTVSATITDAAGNLFTNGVDAGCLYSVSIVDRQAPTIHNLCNQTIFAEAPDQLLYPTPVVSDNVDAAADISVEWQKPEVTENGEYTAVISATDSRGNMVTCSVAIEVGRLSGSKAEMTNGVKGGIAVAVIILVIILCIVLWKSFQHQKNGTAVNFEQIIEVLAMKKKQVPREVERKHVEFVSTLGAGAYGEVFKATLNESSSIGLPSYLVAVKTLKSNASETEKTALLHEAALLAQVHHSHLVNLIGVVTRGEPLCVLLQFCEHGSILDYLRAKKQMCMLRRLLWAGDVADGMAYLHKCGIVHRDLAARNVLVNSTFRCQVSDLGLSRRQTNDVYMGNGGQVAVRWTAPEAMHDKAFSQRTDVWSYGCVLWELYSEGLKPFHHLKTNSEVFFKINEGERLRVEELDDQFSSEIILKCTALRPSERPRFKWLKAHFRKQYTDVRDSIPNLPDGMFPTVDLCRPRNHITFESDDDDTSEQSFTPVFTAQDTSDAYSKAPGPMSGSSAQPARVGGTVIRFGRKNAGGRPNSPRAPRRTSTDQSTHPPKSRLSASKSPSSPTKPHTETSAASSIIVTEEDASRRASHAHVAKARASTVSSSLGLPPPSSDTPPLVERQYVDLFNSPKHSRNGSEHQSQGQQKQQLGSSRMNPSSSATTPRESNGSMDPMAASALEKTNPQTDCRSGAGSVSTLAEPAPVQRTPSLVLEEDADAPEKKYQFV